MKVLGFAASLVAMGLASQTPAVADTAFGELREKTPGYSVALPLSCGSTQRQARLDATHLFGPIVGEDGKPSYAPTNDLYVIWWLDGKPVILEKRDGYATGAEARDINGDGVPELIVRYGAGGHFNGLLIYELKGCNPRLLPGADFGNDVGEPEISSKRIHKYPVLVVTTQGDDGDDPASSTPVKSAFVWNGQEYVEQKPKSP